MAFAGWAAACIAQSVERMSEAIRKPISLPLPPAGRDYTLPAAWREFIVYCRELGHGEIERLSIQDGLPVLAEVTRKKVRFNRDR
jgi:hypothetical protein